jgi:hypothetical protein
MARNTQQTAAWILGAFLTLVGVTGGLIWIFHVNLLHNAVHLVTGILGLWAGFAAGGKFARPYNRWMGVVYLLVTALGLSAPDFMENLLNINMADNFLHLALGVVLAGAGFGIKE